MYKALLKPISRILVALLLVSYFVAPKAAEHHMSWEFKAIGAGLLAAGIIHTAGHCKYGLVDSTVTDPVAGISKPGKVCASAPSSDSNNSDYTEEELKVITKSVDKLNRNMTKNGEPRQKGCARHHIVPEKDNKIPENKDMRDIFENCGININDADNGVNLPYKDDAECKGARHGPLHSDKYYMAIARIIISSFRQNGCSEIRDNLRSIKNDLMENRLDSNGYRK